MAMKALKLAATLLSTLVLTAIGATSAQASTHQSGVSGFEFSATSTEGRFAGTAAGDLSGAWDIWVKHTDLGSCFNHPSDPCTIDAGTFRLAVTNTPEVVTGRFDNPQEAYDAVPRAQNRIQRQSGGNCRNEVFFITDGLKGVGTIGSQHTGTGTFTAWLTHHWKEDPFFHRCFIVGATVQGSVTLIF
jgi:hypothetical protein